MQKVLQKFTGINCAKAKVNCTTKRKPI